MNEQDRVLELFLSFWVTRGLMAAVELDLFELLVEPRTIDAVQDALGMRPRPARALLDTCVAAGLVTREADAYVATDAARKFLSSSSEYSVHNYVRDERSTWDAWGRLEDALRSDAPPLPQDETGYREASADFLLDFLHGHTLYMGERLAAAVSLEGVTELMDVGGGSGAVSIALCRAHPSLRSVVLDLPAVCRRASEHIAGAGLSDRIEAVPTNIFGDALPARCDGAVIANFLHDFSETKARTILARVAEALPSGAPLIVMEMCPNEDRSGPAIPVAFALTMIINTEGGDAYTLPQYRSWLEDAGFAIERVVPLDGSIVTTAIEARKR